MLVFGQLQASEKSVSVPDYVTPSDEILRAVEKTLPSKGGKIPKDIASRLGSRAHVSGKYSFTNKPFLLEGCDDLLQLGFKSVKLWFTQSAGRVSSPL